MLDSNSIPDPDTFTEVIHSPPLVDAERNPSDYLSVLKYETPANKWVTLDDAGKPVKQTGFSLPGLKSAVAKASTVYVPDAEAMRALLEQVAESDSTVIVGGFFPGTEPKPGEKWGHEFNVAPQRILRNMLGGNGADVTGPQFPPGGGMFFARLKENIQPSSWMLFDRDIAPGMPEELATLTESEWLDAMATLWPGLDTAAVVATGSTTARVLVDGEPMQVHGGHFWARGDDPSKVADAGRLAVFRAVSKGLGFRKPSVSTTDGAPVGRGVPWSIFDPTVLHHGRLVFDGKPAVSEGTRLSVAPANIRIIRPEGGVVRCSEMAALNDEERAQISKVHGVTVSNKDGNVRFSDNQTLFADMTFELEDGRKITFKEYRDSPEQGKLRCQVPGEIRESRSMNGALMRTKDGTAMFHDYGTATNYFLSLVDEMFVELGMDPPDNAPSMEPVAVVELAINALADADQQTALAAITKIFEQMLLCKLDAMSTEQLLQRIKPHARKHTDVGILVLRKQWQAVQQTSREKIRRALVPTDEHWSPELWVRGQGQFFDPLSGEMITKDSFACAKARHHGGDTNEVLEVYLTGQNARCSVVEALTFDPSLPPGKCVDANHVARFNIYAPGDVTPILGDVSLWLEILSTLGLEAGKKGEDALLDWMAFKIQNPAVKINSGVLFGGAHGIGKDSFLDPFLEILGRVNVATVNAKAILGDFTWYLRRALLVMLNEIATNDRKEAAQLSNELKGLTADPPHTSRINGKNLREYEIPNVVQVIAQTNYRSPFSLDPGERRWLALWCSKVIPIAEDDPQRIALDARFMAYWDWLKAGGYEAVHYWLLHRDVSKFRPTVKPLRTEWCAQLEGDSLSPLALWIKEEIHARQAVFEHVLATPNDVAQACEMARSLGHLGRENVNPRSVAKALEAAGAQSRRTEGQRYWVFRHEDQAWVDYYGGTGFARAYLDAVAKRGGAAVALLAKFDKNGNRTAPTAKSLREMVSTSVR